jgi:hypothetical protein
MGHGGTISEVIDPPNVQPGLLIALLHTHNLPIGWIACMAGVQFSLAPRSFCLEPHLTVSATRLEMPTYYPLQATRRAFACRFFTSMIAIE